MSEQPTRGNRPWQAEPLRDYIAIRVTAERVSHVGMATEAQVRSLVMALDDVFPSRRDRLASLAWLLRREITSTKDLTKAEASILLGWYNSNHEHARVEAERVLSACLRAQGQLELALPEPVEDDETHDARLARLRELFGGPVIKPEQDDAASR